MERAGLVVRVAELEEIGRAADDGEGDSLQRDVERGLRFAHVMMSISHLEGREGAIYARALADLLVAKGVVAQEELEAKLTRIRQEFEAEPTPKVMLARSEDKYGSQVSVEIDCESRLHLCQAKCCTFSFYLTDQDLDEGTIKWDYGRPYWNRKRVDGRCVHCQEGTWRCQIHPHRPYVCRAYDCRQDERIWRDFEKVIPNPEG